MSKIDSNMTTYLHTYEAYRVPKGIKVRDASGEEMILSGEEDMLVLTEKSCRQLVKDRMDHNMMLLQDVQMAAQKTQQASMEKITDDMVKAMAVYQAMAKGDIVPGEDEKKLQEYSADLYQAAKIAQAMARQTERKKQESKWDEKEEEAYEEKMQQLRDESNEAVLSMGKKSREFSGAQKEHIVEIDSSGVDFSAMKVMNLGSGVTGAYIDLSL